MALSRQQAPKIFQSNYSMQHQFCVCRRVTSYLFHSHITTPDSRLDMRAHIGKIASACFFHLRRLRHLSHTIDSDVRQRLVSALMLSRIDYCNVVFAGLPATTLAPLRRVMNAAIRLVAADSDRVTTSAVLGVIFIGCRLNNVSFTNFVS